MNAQLPQTLRWENDQLWLLDQRVLPGQVEYLQINTLEEAWHAIQTLAVRGAPAIGIAAAYALAQSMQSLQNGSDDDFSAALQRHADYLKSARPTAVNLAWAVDRLVNAHMEQGGGYAALVAEAQRIHAEDLQICQQLGEHGAALIKPGANLLTHCNAGSLAVSRYGTATAPMYHQHDKGVPFHVYVDETRPLFQGARLTAWELDQAGIDVTLICDNMAATLMAQSRVDLVIVGTDRVTANGDVVNKIGTLNLAVLCAHFGVPFYVACPSSTFDPATPSGDAVAIEQRDSNEVRMQHAAAVATYNPAFDVTPNQLVTGIITEHGIARSEAELRTLLS
ncbi:MAG: S-methyl-5-thioribose-1-phosphate isomerase [Pseudomonadota bacterium]